MLKVDALVQFPVAHGAEVERIAVSLLKMVGTHHEALVVDTVTHAEHVAQFVSANLADPHQESILELFIRSVVLTRPLRHVALQALDAAICRDAVPKAKVGQVLSEQIAIGEAEDAYTILRASLNAGNHLFQNMNRVVLRPAEAVGLFVDLTVVFEHRLANVWQDYNLARVIEGLDPSLELVQEALGDASVLVPGDRLDVENVERVGVRFSAELVKPLTTVVVGVQPVATSRHAHGHSPLVRIGDCLSCGKCARLSFAQSFQSPIFCWGLET